MTQGPIFHKLGRKQIPMLVKMFSAGYAQIFPLESRFDLISSLPSTLGEVRRFSQLFIFLRGSTIVAEISLAI